MKRFSLHSLVAVVVVVLFAVACADQTTAPANSHALVAPTGIATDLGKPPPPPVKVDLTVTISSFPHIAPFTGVYFSNGNIHDDGDGLTETFDGTAWLRFDNKQPMPDAGDVSANTRFMVKDDNPPTGMGTFSFGTGLFKETFKIVRVDTFTPFADCGSVGQICAIITFTAALVGTDCDPDQTNPVDLDCHHGHATAINAQGCTIKEFFVGEEEESHFEYVCPPPPDSEIG